MAQLRSELSAVEALIARANDGDRTALEQLYRDHRDWVTGLAYRFTGSHDDALDVLQETFTYFFGKFPGFVLRASLRGFLYPVVKHCSIDILRRRRRVVALDREAEPIEWVQPVVEGDFNRLLHGLNPGQREVVRLRFGLGFRLDEIAEALEVPVGTVKSRLHNALKSLRSELEHQEQG